MNQEDEPFSFSSSRTLCNESVRPTLSLSIPPFQMPDDTDLSPIPANHHSRTQSFNQTFNRPSSSPTPANPFVLSATQPVPSLPVLEDEFGTNSMMDQTLGHPLHRSINHTNGFNRSESAARFGQSQRFFGASWDSTSVERAAPMDWSLAQSSSGEDSDVNSYYTSSYSSVNQSHDTSVATSPRSTSTSSLAVTPPHSSSGGYSPYSPSTSSSRRLNLGAHMRTLSPYDLSYTSIITQVRRRHGASCHLCKTTMPLEQLYVCAAKAKAGERKRRCRKKFCGSCLMRCHDLDMAAVSEEERCRWICVSCTMLCQCAACQRRPQCEAMNQSIKQAMSQSQQNHALPIIQPVRATVARDGFADLFRIKQEPGQQAPTQSVFAHQPHCARSKPKRND